jgi:hypothetical protein
MRILARILELPLGTLAQGSAKVERVDRSAAIFAFESMP